MLHPVQGLRPARLLPASMTRLLTSHYFHELGHAYGPKHCLDHNLTARFGSASIP